MTLENPDIKIKTLQVFRSEDELDMEGLRVTLTNGAQSPDGIGVSMDSDLHATIDLTDLQVKYIDMQKAQEFKAPVGFHMHTVMGPSMDIISELYSDEPAGTFEEVRYLKLEKGQELIGVYGYYQAHYITHLGFLLKEPKKTDAELNGQDWYNNLSVQMTEESMAFN